MIFDKRYFEKVHEKDGSWGYESSSYEEQKYIRQLDVIKQFAPSPRNILEVGCSEGFHTSMMARAFPGVKITSIDISPRALEKAKQKCRDDSNVEFIEGDITGMLERGQFPAESFDVIVQSECLYYLFPALAAGRKVGSYVKSLVGLMRRGGIFVTANGITLPTKFVMPVYYHFLKKHCEPALSNSYCEWSDFRKKRFTYDIKVFRRI